MLTESKLALTVADISELLQISRSKAYELTRQDDFPTIRLGKRIIIPQQGLNEWMKNQSRGYYEN